MPESNMNGLAQKLLGQSKEDKVDWEDTGRRGSYRVIFPDVALTITRESPSSEESYLVFELMNETGRVIDSLVTAPEEPMHPVLSQIFDLAAGHVRDTGITKALEYLA